MNILQVNVFWFFMCPDITHADKIVCECVLIAMAQLDWTDLAVLHSWLLATQYNHSHQPWEHGESLKMGYGCWLEQRAGLDCEGGYLCGGLMPELLLWLL